MTRPNDVSTELRNTRNLLKRLLPVCAICGKPLEGHSFKAVAKTPVEKDDSTKALALLDAVKRVQWDEILSFQEFEPLLPTVSVYAFRCLDGTNSLAVFLLQYELYARDELLTQKTIASGGDSLASADWSEL